MSLKSFHIVFIIVASLFAFGFAYWLFREFDRTHDALVMAGCAASALAGAGLIVYGIRFLKKLKHVSFL